MSKCEKLFFKTLFILGTLLGLVVLCLYFYVLTLPQNSAAKGYYDDITLDEASEIFNSYNEETARNYIENFVFDGETNFKDKKDSLHVEVETSKDLSYYYREAKGISSKDTLKELVYVTNDFNIRESKIVKATESKEQNINYINSLENGLLENYLLFSHIDYIKPLLNDNNIFKYNKIDNLLKVINKKDNTNYVIYNKVGLILETSYKFINHDEEGNRLIKVTYNTNLTYLESL